MGPDVEGLIRSIAYFFAASVVAGTLLPYLLVLASDTYRNRTSRRDRG